MLGRNRLELIVLLIQALRTWPHPSRLRHPQFWPPDGSTARSPYCPVPVSAIVCGLLLALSVTVSVAVRVPVAPGVKVREIVQLDLAATLPPHVFVSAKSPGSAPVNAMLIGKAVVRLLPNSTFHGELVLPTVCAANATEGVES